MCWAFPNCKGFDFYLSVCYGACAEKFAVQLQEHFIICGGCLYVVAAGSGAGTHVKFRTNFLWGRLYNKTIPALK
jgi:hypothetical protein